MLRSEIEYSRNSSSPFCLCDSRGGPNMANSSLRVIPAWIIPSSSVSVYGLRMNPSRSCSPFGFSESTRCRSETIRIRLTTRTKRKAIPLFFISSHRYLPCFFGYKRHQLRLQATSGMGRHFICRMKCGTKSQNLIHDGFDIRGTQRVGLKTGIEFLDCCLQLIILSLFR